MPDWIKSALTRKIRRKGARNREHVIQVEPSRRTVLIVKFVLVMTGCLSCLEVAHLIVLKSWNSEIFAGITGMIGTVTGVVVGQRA